MEVMAVLHMGGSQREEISGRLLCVTAAGAQSPKGAAVVWLKTSMGMVGVLNRGDGWHRTFELMGGSNGHAGVPANGVG